MSKIRKKINSFYISMRYLRTIFRYRDIIRYYSIQKNGVISEMCKLLKKKWKGEHPSKKEMIRFVRNFHDLLSCEIMRPYNKDDLFPESKASYCQYLIISLDFDISESRMEISCLPYQEILDIFDINPKKKGMFY